MRRVFVHVDRLVVQDHDIADARVLADALRIELASMLASGTRASSIDRHLGDHLTIDAGRVAHDATPRGIGRRAGHAIASRLATAMRGGTS